MGAPITTLGAQPDDGPEHAPVLAIRWVHPSEAAPPAVCPATSSSVRLGRGESCEHVIAGSAVSREHAELSLEGGRPVLRDLQSRNGVFVDGARIERAMLSRGQVVRIGDWVGLVEPLEPMREHGVLHEVAAGFHVGRALRATVEAARRATTTGLPVIIEGETGVGKKRLARAMHEWSGARGPFLVVSCAALPPAFVDAELFGYRRGAIPGALDSGAGLFREARGGTLLLDDLAELPLATQAKLVRVLERREIVPVGELSAVPIDVRVIAAGQLPLATAVRAGTLRSDLLAHLDNPTIRLPPLRERRLEAVPLFRRLLADRTGNAPPDLDARFVECLSLHDWPFNVREVDRLARQLLVRHGFPPLLKRGHLPERMRLRPLPDGTPAPNDSPAGALAAFGVEEDEQQLTLLGYALRANAGNVARAAGQIGISRQRAYTMMASTADDAWVAVRRPRS